MTISSTDHALGHQVLQLDGVLETLRQHLNAAQYEDALREADFAGTRYPDHRDILLIKASALRHLKRTNEALDVLKLLEEFAPQFSLLHQEYGLCHVAKKDAPAAIDALLRAVNINPALPMSWRILEGVYRLTGDETNAATAAAHSATLAALPSPIVQATSLFADGDIKPAEKIIRAFLLDHGDHPEAMRLLAKIAVEYDVLDDAEALLEGALVLAPDHHAARYEYASVLTKRQKYGHASVQIAQLRTHNPNNVDYQALAATICCGSGQHVEAIELYRSMILAESLNADIYLWLGHALKTVGRLPEAIAAYHDAITARSDFGDAWWSLANLKTYRFTSDDITAMRASADDQNTAQIDQVHLCFALGKAHEDAQDYAESWVYYAKGNALQRAASKYRPEILETNTQLQKQICTPAFFAARQDWGAPDVDPIFILGLPRAGSTLIEQILASHSQVEGTQELIDIQRMVHELQGRDPDLDNPRYPSSLVDLTLEQARKLGERYIADTKIYRTSKPFFIDKMPNNFRHIGLIQLILPNAKIIDARRDPMACCFSNLKQLFAQGQEFTYSIEDIARYYRTYVELMKHWDIALPGKVLRVEHEDVIDDLEGNVRRILEHCGLPFEQSCVEFHKTKRSVRTPSSEQVRQPIFRDSLAQWKHYSEWLEPLQIALNGEVLRAE